VAAQLGKFSHRRHRRAPCNQHCQHQGAYIAGGEGPLDPRRRHACAPRQGHQQLCCSGFPCVSSVRACMWGKAPADMGARYQTEYASNPAQVTALVDG